MGILDDFGVGEVLPSIDIGGFLSNTWFYVVIIFIIGFIGLMGVGVLLFFKTYKKRIVLFENISGQGYQPTLKTRARIVKLGIGGEELLKTFAGNHYVSAYGRKMGKNTYWYAIGQDGYWYNILVGDLDAKQAILDIEPIDRDVRMFHVALDRLSHQTYGKQSWLEKHAVHLLLFVFLIVLILGMWFIVGKIGEAVEPLATAGDNAVKIQQANDKTLVKLDALIRTLGYAPKEVEKTGGSGLAPAG